jgi:hypothetical protein
MLAHWQTRSVYLTLLAVALLSVAVSAEQTTSKPGIHDFTHVMMNRVVIGSVADVFSNYRHGQPITVVLILEFATDDPLNEPDLLQVRLCGDHGELEAVVHTNITLIYTLASQSRLTGCLRLISSEPWQDGSKWHIHDFQARRNETE